MRRKVGLAFALLSGLAASPLFASFHFVKIVQVFKGTVDEPDAQYVMLQMWTGGQNLVGGHSLTFYNGDGTPAATATFPPPPGGNLPNGVNQDTFLVGTAQAAALFGVPMDLTIPPVHVTGEGAKVCWLAGEVGVTPDCVAFGVFTGSSTGVGTSFLFAGFTHLALTRKLDICSGPGTSPTALDSCDDTDDSASDFVLTLPSPKNNARVSGTPPESTCGNHTLEGLEDCDDGNTDDGDGCSSKCAIEPSDLTPTALSLDTTTNSSDGNGVFEPGEAVLVVPTWKNGGGSLISVAGGATAFTGPAGAAYEVNLGLANYGSIDSGDAHDCTATGFCYQLGITPSGPRPGAHWDAAFDERIGDATKTWTLHVGDSFTDVPRSYLFYRRVETVLHHGITTGCSATQYCPNDKVRRDQMGLFLGRALAHGGANIPTSGSVGGSPYNCVSGGVSLFTDVLPTDSTCKAIHYIAVQNVTGGCGGGLFCVGSNVTRAEMALFEARGLFAPLGGGAVPNTYGPDPVTGRSYSCDAGSPNVHFTDVSTADSFCKHVHYLWARGIVSGCTTTEYCPAGQVTRGEMARFLSGAFAPNLYEP